MAKKAEEKETKATEKAEKAEKKAEEKISHKAEEKATEAKEAEKPKEPAEAKEIKEETPVEKIKEEKPKHEHKAKDEKHEHKEKHAEEKHKEKPKKAKHARKEFVELKPAEINEAIVHLANEGHSASEIGMILRDQYGIPKVGKVVGKKLGEILKENKLAHPIPEDLMSLIRKSVTLRSHMDKNKKDQSAKRGLMLTVSKIRALEKYYKKKGKLPLKWRYTPETAALLAK